MAKRPVEKYDFKAFGEAIKAARRGRKESRKQVSDETVSYTYLPNAAKPICGTSSSIR